MSTALDICARAYKRANLEQPLASFFMQDFPFNLALDLINLVIQEMNSMGHYWFTETYSSLMYSPGVNEWNFSSFQSDPKGILRIRKELAGFKGELTEVNYRYFQQNYRINDVVTGEPRYWAKYGNSFVLDTIPDKDYNLVVYHLRDMPLIVENVDTLLCQETDEHVFQEGVYAYLLNSLQRPDWDAAYANFQRKANNLLADMNQDQGLARQWPAAF